MEKVFITDKQGKKVLPKTHVSAVYDDEGNDLGSHLGAFEDEVRGLVDTPHQEYVTVATYASLPSSGSEDTIYRVSNYDGSQSQVAADVYSEYAWDGTQYVFLCVKSAVGEVFDISAYHNNAKYADLNAALTSNTGGVPQSLQKGGMSVKFVQSSDNKYVQFRYMPNDAATVSKFTNVANWQGVDDEPTAGSDNLVKSGGIAQSFIEANEKIGRIFNTNQAPQISNSWVQGTFTNEGEPNYNTSKRIILESYIQVTPNTLYTIGISSGFKVQAYLYDASKLFLSNTGFANSQFESGTAHYLRLLVGASDERDITVQECIGNEITLINQEDYVGDRIMEHSVLYNDNSTFDNQKTLKENIAALDITRLVYGSSTNQLFDGTKLIKGVYGDSAGHGSFVNHRNGIISIPLYIGHLLGKNLTFSGITGVVIFMSSNKIANSSCIRTLYLENNTRTTDIRNGEKYLTISLRETSSTPIDISSCKVSIGSTISSDSYVERFIGISGDESNFNNKVIFENLSDNVTNSSYTPIIYGTNSNLLIDISSTLKGYYMDISGNGTFIKDANGVISKPIYVGHLIGKNITISGYQSNWLCNLVFLSNFGIGDDTLCLKSRLATNTSRTFEVVVGAKYAVITLYNPTSNIEYDYSTIKLSIGLAETQDNYEKKYLGIAGNEENFYPSKNYYPQVLLNERFDVEKRAIPYAIGTPQNSFVWSTHYNRLNLLFFTDNHIDSYPESVDNVKDTIDFAINTKIPINCILNGGDFITPYDNTPLATAKELAGIYFGMVKANTSVPFLQAIGNHDGNDWNNVPANAISEQDWDEMFFDWQRSTFGTVHNNEGTYNNQSYQSPYFYYDLDNYKVRIVCLYEYDFPRDSEHIDSTTGNCLYSGRSGSSYIRQEQFDWFINKALNFSDKDEKDWGVILLGHSKETYGVKDINDIQIVSSEDSAINKALLILKALNEQSVYANNYMNSSEPDFNLSINADFSSYAGASKKPYVIAYICGHDHYDSNRVVNGINVIITQQGAAGIYASDGRINRVRGTQTQNAFDIFSIDTTTRKIYVTRYGAAMNCFGDNGNGDRFKPNGLSF